MLTRCMTFRQYGSTPWNVNAIPGREKHVSAVPPPGREGKGIFRKPALRWILKWGAETNLTILWWPCVSKWEVPACVDCPITYILVLDLDTPFIGQLPQGCQATDSSSLLKLSLSPPVERNAPNWWRFIIWHSLRQYRLRALLSCHPQRLWTGG